MESFPNVNRGLHLAANAPWFDHLPISVNDTYGDPFIPEQVDNTLMKLKRLKGHNAPIAIFTKAPHDPNVLRKLHYALGQGQTSFRNAVVYYSLTGLDEAGYSFENRVRMIEELERVFPFVVVFTRPIIRGRNDNIENLRRLVEVAATHREKLLVLGGVHDRYKSKNIEKTVEEQLIDLCDAVGVKSFHKTSCCAAYIHGLRCWVHDPSPEPFNLEVVDALGYEYIVHQGEIHLERATTGDINFLRMLTGAHVFVGEIISNYNLLTIRSGDQKFEATSSWYAWSENIPTCLDCDYCIIKQIEYLRKFSVRIGTHPADMVDHVSASKASHDFITFRLTKLQPLAEHERHTYKDVRQVKPCFVGRYEPKAFSSASTETWNSLVAPH